MNLSKKLKVRLEVISIEVFGLIIKVAFKVRRKLWLKKLF